MVTDLEYAAGKTRLAPGLTGAYSWEGCGKAWGKVESGGDKSPPQAALGAMFLGEFDHALDDRGRLAIPARFRAELEHGLYITRGLDRCLVIWDSAAWTAMAERVRQLNPWQGDARRMQRHFFAGAVQAVPDKLGRVLIPQYLRAYAGLDSDVVVVGLADRIEVWARAEWERERAESENGGADLAEHLVRSAGGAAA